MADHSELDKLAKVAADVLNAISKLVHGGGVLGLIGLYPDVSLVGSEDWNALKSQLSSLSDSDRRAVEELFSNSLDLVDKAVQAKLQNSVNLLDDGLMLVESVLPLIRQAEDLLAQAKQLLS